MPTQDRMDLAADVSPVSVLVRGVLEWALPDDRLRVLYDQAPRCWTRSLTIESLFWLVIDVVSGARNAVFAAYQAERAQAKPSITASVQALYDKLARMPTEFGTALLRESSARLQPLLAHANPNQFPGLKKYRVIIVDGTDLGGTEHRLSVLRRIKAAGLPGRLVVAYDWSTEICLDAIASQDAYTSERRLVREILGRSQPRDLYVMDRYYCTTPVIQAIREREARFVIREDIRNLRCREEGRPKQIGRVATGQVAERKLVVEDPKTGECFNLRQLILELDQPTDDGEWEIRLLSNLPSSVSALRIVDLYRERWTLERHFDFLKNCLHGEIETLGKPCAALFMMFLAMVAGNALSVVRHGIRVVHGDDEMQHLSGYYLADELAKNMNAVEVLVDAAAWQQLQRKKPSAFWAWTVRIAKRIRPRAFYKHPRGPKKPPPRRDSGKHRHHYSIYRLLHPDKIP